jgi:hypothetical protein
MALDFGVKVDPSKCQRAMNDVYLMIDMLKASGTTVKEIVEDYKSPWVYIAAEIPPPWEDNGEGRDFVKSRGYNWETCRGTSEPVFKKKWVKRVRARRKDEEKSLEWPDKYKRYALKV